MATGFTSFQWTLTFFNLKSLQEVLPPALTSTSAPPSLVDGTTRDLQDKKKLVRFPSICKIGLLGTRSKCILLTWKCCPIIPIPIHGAVDFPVLFMQVPSLEHNNEVKGESLDLIKYIDNHFDGPSLLPDDPAKKEFADRLFSYTDSFNKAIRSTFSGNNDSCF